MYLHNHKRVFIKIKVSSYNYWLPFRIMIHFTCKFAQDSVHVILQVHTNVLIYRINTSVIQICTLLQKIEILYFSIRYEVNPAVSRF